ncbi:MAG TPA: helix-turn-helix domain-containing protein [Pseudonocardia sp.]
MTRGPDAAALNNLTDAVVGRLPMILADVHVLLEARDAGYAAFLTAEYEEVLTAARYFVRRLFEADGAPEAGVERPLFEEIGRAHRRADRPVAPLLAMYRAGSAVVWRHLAAIAIPAGVSADVVAFAAERVLGAVDLLSAATLDGYLDAASDTGEQARVELHEMLLSGRSSTQAVQDAAHRAGWPIPRTASVVVVEADDEGDQFLRHLPERPLYGRLGDLLVAVVPDPDGPARRERLRRALAGSRAVVGLPGLVDALPGSIELAQLAHRLQGNGVLRDDPTFVDEHLDALVVHRDDRVLAELRARCLAPLDAVPEGTRERLVETLECWLSNMGRPAEIAECLHVHPQTVRYRLRRLREVFKKALDDPAYRATLTLALAWGPPGGGHHHRVDGATDEHR